MNRHGLTLAAAALLERTGAIARRRRQDGLAVLMLKKVNDHPSPLSLTLAPHLLEAALAEIGRHHDVVPLNEAVTAEGVRPEPGLRFALTFDDGYRDNHRNAFPILRRMLCPATVYLSVEHVEGTRTFWYERLEGALAATRAASLDLSDEGLGRLPLSTPRDRERAEYRLNDHLKGFDEQTREARLEAWLERLGVDGAPAGSPMLNWEMVAEMAEAGVAFGSHSLSHPILSRETPERVEREVAGSKRALEERLGRPVRSFAYPNGTAADFDDGVVAAVREAGYASACTTIPGLNTADTDPFRLHRVKLHDRMMTDAAGAFAPALFWCKVLGLL